jgi:EAL domain-containing protein (putative c-di-GMP-specific phosphodiesterase class I)
VREGELVVHYQPLIDLATGDITGYEALLRWNHPERGLLYPDSFIPLAEEIGMIDVVGQYVLQAACREAATWPGGIKLAVNASPLQFRGANLLNIILQALATSGLEPSRLELEITEAVLMDRSPQIASLLESIRALGVGISMDDFGTGYSSLSYLLSYPFTKIKIDKSFIMGLREANSKAVVSAIIGLGQSLGMTVTAEGIEEPEHLDYLRGIGCGQGQGYLIGRAIPGDQLPHEEERRRNVA